MIDIDANEKVIVTFFLNDKVTTALWTLEQLWAYESHALRTGQDPYDLMHIEQNLYALGRAEVFGMRKERMQKYGRS